MPFRSRTRFREFRKKKHKVPGVYKIPSELIQAGGDKLYEEIHKLLLIWNTEELPQEQKESIIDHKFSIQQIFENNCEYINEVIN